MEVSKYTSALLFHGPGAQQTAESELDQIGRAVAPPFGLDGLKIDDARAIIGLMETAPVGDRPGALLIGPLDRARQQATDVLLKVIEEFDPKGVRPVVWAHDIGGVAPTIRSRCLHRWCPGEESVDETLMNFAFELIDAYLTGDCATVIEIIDQQSKTDAPDLLEAVVKALSTNLEQMDGDRYALWVRVRRLLQFRLQGSKVGKMRNEMIAVFLNVEAL